MPYDIKWTEVSSHRRTISDEEMARIKGVSLPELKALDEDDLSCGLNDELAELDDDGFEGLEREIERVIVI
ncbi:hypothetical protein AB0O57_29690 [Streptomyces sp. NPDC091201]|uniref:hypothetical protein n=1 Tax=Streptomyces sp. NPDC091201 TaxID=3155190 RepID=UPI003425B426